MWNRLVFIFICVCVFLASGCRKNPPILSQIPNAAFVRVFTDFNINIDANSSALGPAQYLYLNGNFDTAIDLTSVRYSDPDIYNQPPKGNGGLDEYIFFNYSYYSWGSIVLDNNGQNDPYFDYYPNYFNRVVTAPVIDSFDFYKWAQVASGKLRLTFTSVIAPPGNHPQDSLRGVLLDTTVEVSNGDPYTYLLTLGPDNLHDTLLSIREKPESLRPAPQTCYVRFVNVSTDNSGLTDDLDVYLLVRRVDAPTFPVAPNYSDYDTLVDNQFIGTVSGRYNTAGAAFLPLPVLADTAFLKNGVLRLDDELPGFILQFYKKGEAPGPNTSALFLLTSFYGPKRFGFSGVDPYQQPPSVYASGTFWYPYVFDPLGGIHPTVNTFVTGARRGGANAGTVLGLTRYVWEPLNEEVGFRR